MAPAAASSTWANHSPGNFNLVSAKTEYPHESRAAAEKAERAILEEEPMALFSTEFMSFDYAKLDAAKRWWIATFDCKQVPLPEWDDPLPSDIALKLPGFGSEAAILLRNRAEAGGPVNSAPAKNQIIFCQKLEKAHEYLSRRRRGTDTRRPRRTVLSSP
jgi:hypothetical protein